MPPLCEYLELFRKSVKDLSSLHPEQYLVAGGIPMMSSGILAKMTSHWGSCAMILVVILLAVGLFGEYWDCFSSHVYIFPGILESSVIRRRTTSPGLKSYLGRAPKGHSPVPPVLGDIFQTGTAAFCHEKYLFDHQYGHSSL